MKCDERPGVCLNCERLHLDCQRADGSRASPPAREQPKASQSPGLPPGDVGVKRKRTFRSCKHCRASKARCSGQKPSCARCIQRSVDCVYDEDSAPQWTKVIAQPDTLPNTSPRFEDSTTHTEDDARNSHETMMTGERDGSSTPITMSIESPAHATATQPTTSRGPVSEVSLRRSASARPLTTDEGPDSLQW